MKFKIPLCGVSSKADCYADALYFSSDDSPVAESEEVSPCIIIDYNENNEIVAIEILHLLKRDNKQAMVRSSWIIRRGENFPRLMSCYIL